MNNTKQLYSFLYYPGFSTKETADNVSGRGVGLDVVAKNIAQVNGKTEIISEPGKGTTFLIKLPLTLAIIDGFVTVISGEKYIFPFNLVEEILVPRDTEITTMENGLRMLLTRGRHIPIMDLKQILLNDQEWNYHGQYAYILINFDESHLAVPVDRVLGKQEIVIKTLNDLLRQRKFFSSGTIFGDGTIGFILDIEEIVSYMDKIYK